MALTSESVTALEGIRDRLQQFGKGSHREHGNDLYYTIKVIMDRYRAGDILSPDEVAEWARENGWTEDEAAQLSNDVETVNYTMDIREGKTVLE